MHIERQCALRESALTVGGIRDGAVRGKKPDRQSARDGRVGRQKSVVKVMLSVALPGVPALEDLVERGTGHGLPRFPEPGGRPRLGQPSRDPQGAPRPDVGVRRTDLDEAVDQSTVK